RLDGGNVQGRDDPPPLPRDLAPEIAEARAGALVGPPHRGVVAVGLEHRGPLGFTHGRPPRPVGGIRSWVGRLMIGVEVSNSPAARPSSPGPATACHPLPDGSAHSLSDFRFLNVQVQVPESFLLSRAVGRSFFSLATQRNSLSSSNP